MPEYTYLVGAEDVKNAGHSIHASAERIGNAVSSAANTVQYTAERTQEFITEHSTAAIEHVREIFDEHATRIETALIDHADARLTLRDQFAMAALPGVLASPLAPGEVGWCFDSADHVARIARFSYALADAMLKARLTEEA